MRKPYLTLKVEADYVPYEVFVNGGFVITDLSGWSGEQSSAINPWLRAGSNEISVLLYPWHNEDQPASFDPQAHLSLRVTMRDLAESASPQIEVLRIDWNGAKLNAVADAADALGPLQAERVDSDEKLLLTQAMRMRLPFPEWAFFGSETAAPTYTLSEQEIEPHYQKLLAAYENIWQLLEAKQIERLMPLFAERSREIDLALFHPEGTTQAKLRESLERAVHDETRSLAPIRPAEGAWKYDVGPSGRLQRLSDGAQSSAIIRFPEKQDPLASIGYGIAFRKQGDDFIVAR
jgi:hypothetical protein